MPLETFAKRMSQEWREYASADNLIPVDGDARFPDDMEARNEIIDILSSFSSRDDLARQILDDAQRNDPEYQQQEYERQQKEDYDQQARDLGYKDYDDMIRQQQQAESRQWMESQETGRLDYQQTPYFAEGWQGTPDRIQQTGVTEAQHQAIFEQGAKAFQTATERAVSEHRAVTLQDFEQAYRERSGQYFDTDRPYLQRYYNHFRDQANRDYKRRLQADQARARGQEPAEHPERIAAEQRRAEAAETERLQAEQAAQEAQRQAQATTEIPEPDGKTPSLDQAKELDNAQRTAANLGLPVIFTDSDNPIHTQGAADARTEATRRGSNAYVFFPKGGGAPRIVINVDRCDDWHDVYLKTLHEGSAHYGLRQMFGKDYDTFLDNVYDAANDELRAGIDQYLNYNPQYKRDSNGQPLKDEEGRDMRDNLADRRQAVDEYLAHLAEKRPQDLTQPERTLWAKIKEWFINLLRQKGFNIKRLTDEDLIDLLRESHRRLLQQEAARRQASPEAPADRTQVLRTGEPGAPAVGETPAEGEGGKVLFSLADDILSTEKIDITIPDKELLPEDRNVYDIYKNKEQGWRNTVADWAISKLPESTTTSFGQIQYRKAKIRGALAHGYGDLKVLTLPHLDRMFKDGILFDQHEEDGFTYYNVAHMLRYNGEDYIARLVAREDKNGNLFYDHEFTEIKKIGAPASGREGNTATSPHQSTAKILENIIAEKLFEEKNNSNSQNSPTDQTNSQKSATEQGKNPYSLPEDTTPEERARIEQERRLPLSQKQKQPGKDHTARFSPEDFAIDWKAYGHDFGMSRPADHLATDTDEAGTTRYSLTKRTRQTIDGWLRKRPDITDEQRQEVLDLLDQSDDTAYQLAAGKWFATGKVRLPEDSEKIQQAVEVARRAKVDPLKYDSPAALIEAHADIQIKERPVDPATLSTLTNPRAVGNGIVIYDVADTEEARQDMRHVIDTHFGPKANPWCLLQKGEDGQLTEDSKKFWYDTYNAYSKQVAFQDGRLAAFSANDNYDVVWWDRFDEARGGIPVSIDRPDIGKGVKQEIEILPDGTEDTDTSCFFRGTPNKPDSTYETFWEDGKPKSRQRYNKDGIRISSEEWYQDGQRKMQATYDSRGNIEKQERWTPEGQQTILIDVTDKGIFRKWNPEGVLKESGQYKDGALEGTWEKWNDNGVLIDRARYTAGKENGLHESWFQDGVKRKEYQMADGKPEGTSTEWNHDGTISTRRNFHNGWLEGRQEWYIDGELREVENYKDTHRHGEQKLYVPRYKEWSTTYYIEGKKATRQEWENYEARATESPKGTDRYSIFGGNKGYVGYSMSKRAEQARDEGRYPKTDFKREYKVGEKPFSILSRIGVIESGEWHHTSKYGNRTTFHKWEEPWTADAYLENKAEIDKLCKQYDAKLVEKGNIKGNWPETAPEYNRLDAEMEAISDQIRTIIDTSNARAAYEESERQQQEKLNQQLAEANRTAQLRTQYNEEVVGKQPVPATLDLGDGWTIQTNGSRNHTDWQYFRNGNEWKYFNSRNKDLERDLNRRADQMLSPSLTFEQWRKLRETANNNEQGTDRFALGDSPETFKDRQERAVKEYGHVMPDLDKAEVKVFDILNHPYTGSWFEAVSAAKKDAVEKYTHTEIDEKGKEKRVPIPQTYDNFGQHFKYYISTNSIDESVNPEQIGKSKEQNVPQGVHLAILNHLDEVINESIEVEEQPYYLKDETGKHNPAYGFNKDVLVHVFMGAIMIDGKTYRVKTTMFEYKQNKVLPREYAYDVSKVEVLDEESPNTSSDLTDVNEHVNERLPLAKLLNNIEKTYDKVKKLIEKSKNNNEDQKIHPFLTQIGETDGMSFEQRKEYVKEKIGPRLDSRDRPWGYSIISKINPLKGFFRPDIPAKVPYREVFKTPTVDDYYISTNAKFEYVGPKQSEGTDPSETEAENRRIWQQMKESGQYEWHKSPLSDSEYLVDRKSGDIYRLADHWGKVSSCNWQIDNPLHKGNNQGSETCINVVRR